MTSFIWENKLQILTKIDLSQYKLKSELKTLALIPSLQDKYLKIVSDLRENTNFNL